MKKSAKRLLGVVFTLALMTILACGAFAAKPAVELTDVYFTVDAFDGVSPTVCFRNNSNKTIKYVTFTLVPLNAVGDRTSCTISDGDGPGSRADCSDKIRPNGRKHGDFSRVHGGFWAVPGTAAACNGLLLWRRRAQRA